MPSTTLSAVEPGEVMMGTTIMAVEYSGGVVLGADSRTTTGSYISNRVTNKITELHDSRIFCCRSGSAADTQTISDLVSLYLQIHSTELLGPNTSTVHTAASLFSRVCYANKANLLASIICAGWDRESGGSVYKVELGGTTMRQPYAIGGSGSTYVIGYCDANFKPGMTKEECLRFVRNAVALAMYRDGSSGGVIRTVVVEESGITREMIPGDKLPTINGI